jgi:hypothetical protein
MRSIPTPAHCFHLIHRFQDNLRFPTISRVLRLTAFTTVSIDVMRHMFQLKKLKHHSGSRYAISEAITESSVHATII